jgi:hypothetical protein
MRVALILILALLLITGVYVPPSIKKIQGTYSTLKVIQTEEFMLARVVNDMEYPIVCYIVNDGSLVTKTLEPGARVPLIVESREIPTWRCKPI